MADALHDIKTIRQALLERQLRRKALAEGVLLLAAIAAAFLLLPGLKLALLGTLAIGGLGLALFLARRGRDLRQLASADDWRAQALEGRGLSLAEWHAGAELPNWTERR